ncbi:hypothetical protein DRQ50_14360 [bacterium]|nr:MAG: hypothetical protein DRQ50_14360 [bacterium]
MSLQGLLKFILLTLPFTNSVTLSVGFPLKAYEGAGFLALGVLMAGKGVRLGDSRRIVLLWWVFLFGSLLASAWGLNEILSRDLSMLEWAHGRYDPLINTLFHYSYLAFDIGLMVLVLHVLENRLLSLEVFCRWWTYGALLSVLYAVALNVVLAAGLSATLLLRFGETSFMDVAGISVARTGPFEEGNYFGLYLLTSFVVAFYAGRRWPAPLFRWILPALLLGVVITASPAALMGVGVLVLVALVVGGVSSPVRNGSIALGVLVLAALIKTGLFQTVVLDKFSLLFMGGVVDTRNVSLIIRLNESYHAWQMFLDFPWGVGMGNFGYFFSYYPDLYTWLETDFNNFKPIANNVYLEVLSEHGLGMFLLFLFLLYSKVSRLVRAREFLVTAGFLLVCVYFVAFPTFRLSFIWLFWAFAIYLGRPVVDIVQTEAGK